MPISLDPSLAEPPDEGTDVVERRHPENRYRNEENDENFGQIGNHGDVAQGYGVTDATLDSHV